ncbi:MAG: hypothetical protein ACSHX6_08215 [Akkermansiaceae bacterium]
MKKNFTTLLLTLISAFAFTSCGDSEEAVVDDLISLMEESIPAVTSGDKDALAKLEEKAEKIRARAKALGFDADNPSTMPEELKKKYDAAVAKTFTDIMDHALKGTDTEK